MCSRDAIDVDFLRSTSGILKISCLLFSLFGALCILGASWANVVPLSSFRSSYFVCITVAGSICTLCIVLARLFKLGKYRFYHLDMVKYEMYLNCFFAFTYFVAAAMAISLDVAACTAASFFGYFAFCVYCFEIFLAYRASRRRDLATQTELSCFDSNGCVALTVSS